MFFDLKKLAMWANCSGCSPKMSDVSEVLRSLTKSEQPWVICSGRSQKISNHERIAQVAHQKWANRFFWVNRSFAIFSHKKTSDSLRKPMSEFPALAGSLVSRGATFISNRHMGWRSRLGLLYLEILKRIVSSF